MHDDRYGKALDALRASTVEPALLPDDRIPAASSSRSLFAWLGAALMACGVVASAWWWMAQHGHTEQSVQPSTSLARTSTAHLEVPSAAVHDEVVSPDVTHDRGDLPDGLLVLDLSPAELRALGITIHEGGTRVTVERVLLAGQHRLFADELRRIGIEEQDSLALIRASIDITADTVFGERLIGKADLSTSEHLSVLAFRRNVVSQGAEFDAFFSAVLDDALLRDFVYWSMDSVMDHIEPGRTDGVVPTNSDLWSDRSRRPVIWAYRFPKSDRMLVVCLLPTKGLRSTLPARYRADLDRVYERYTPAMPTSMRVPAPWQPEWDRPKLVLSAEQAGLTAIEPGPEELWRLGIAVGPDSVAIALTSLGAQYRMGELVSVADTVAMICSSYHPFVVDSASPTAALTYQDTVRLVRPGTSGQTWMYEVPEASSFRVVGVDGKPRSGSMGSSGTTLQSLDSAWKARFPFFSHLAFRVAFELSTTFTSIDSLLRYEVVVDDLRIPVSKILVPVRVVGPYGRRVGADTSPVRADVVYWYAPSDRFFASLPERTRTFVADEYAAIARILEDHLSAADLCSMLDSPSVLGLCSIADTVLRVDGVGPIPARESMTIFLRSAVATTATITLVDDGGRTVLERSGVPIEPGANRIVLDVGSSAITRGAYTVVLTTGVGVRTSRVLIER